MKFSNPTKLIITLGVPQIVGLLGSIIMTPAFPDWYGALLKSPLTPPGEAFGLIWAILYFLMGVASYVIWHKESKKTKIKGPLGIFAFQLFLNLLWVFLFFYLRNPGSALIEILSLWTAVLATMISFFKISRFAGWLIVPYLLWVSFACYLNYYIWAFNP
jgi:translocator protein